MASNCGSGFSLDSSIFLGIMNLTQMQFYNTTTQQGEFFLMIFFILILLLY